MLRVYVALAVLAAATFAAAGDVSELVNNPFARPDISATSATRGNDSGPWPEQLRATLVNGARSLANVDGTLVAVGENIDGAIVTHIGEGVVTLARGDTTRTLTLENDVQSSPRRGSRE